MDIVKLYSFRELASAGGANYQTAYAARCNGEIPQPDTIRGARAMYSEALAEQVLDWMRLNREGREIVRTKARLEKLQGKTRSVSKGGAK